MVITPEVVEGNDGWLFLAGGSNAVLSLFSRSESELDALVKSWSAILSERLRKARALNCKYLHVIVPDKLSIYREEFNHDGLELRYPAEAFDRHCDALGLSGAIIPLTPYFRKQKEKHQLFWKTDTHWTIAGCYCAYQMICAYLAVAPLESLILLPRSNAPNAVLDLGGKLDPPRTESIAYGQFGRRAKRIYANELVLAREQGLLKNGIGYHVGSLVQFENTLNEAANLHVLVFGDSFFEYRTSSLTGMFADTIRKITFVWSSWIDWTLVQELKPDVVITEIAERFIGAVPNDTRDIRKHAAEKLVDLDIKPDNPYFAHPLGGGQ